MARNRLGVPGGCVAGAPHPHSPQGGVPRVLAATKLVGLGWMRMDPGRCAPSTWGRRESGRGAGSVKATDRAFRKVTPGPNSKAQRTVSAGARKRLCPFAAALCRGGGRERVRPRASASAAVSPHPPRARAGGGRVRARGAAGAGPELAPARPGSRPSCCAGTCRAAEFPRRCGAGQLGDGSGEGGLCSCPSPSGGETEAR